VIRGNSSRTSHSGHARRALPLDPETRQAVRSFVRILGRSGCDPLALEVEMQKACRRIPRSWLGVRDKPTSADPGHVMTLWFSDPACLDSLGNPRPLPLRGPLSIESLTRRVNPNLEVPRVLQFLERGGALKRVGSRYAPRERMVIFRGSDHVRPALGGLFGLLKTLEYNRLDRNRGRFQVFCFNPNLPLSAVAGFQERFRKQARQLVVRADVDLVDRERARKKGERTVRIGGGVYQFTDDPRPANRVRRARERTT
jgi:hypothetical protein